LKRLFKMKKIIFLLLSAFVIQQVRAQEQQNIADLDALYEAIQKVPSYKAQLKNDRSYQELYETLRKDLKSTDDFVVYQQLLKLIYPLRDNHLGFYRKPDSAYRFTYLKPPIDAAEMEQNYKGFKNDTIVGVYQSLNGKYKTVIYAQSPKVFYMQNLGTGVVETILNQTAPSRFEVIRFLNPPVPYVLNRNVRYRNGRLDDLPYRKTQDVVYNELVKGPENFEYKQLEDGLGYLRLSSFSAYDVDVKKATDFFNQTKAQITEQNLIVDVRNNGGGAYKTSQQFINFLRGYKGHVYILQNGFSVSNAEQFILSLKGRENITTMGETTKGMITYGSNYGKTVALPSGRFVFYPTDMPGVARDLQYEDLGVDPDVKLDPLAGDWINQVKAYIKKKN
jgi:hypothetical protein